jgi:hypothetical protein
MDLLQKLDHRCIWVLPAEPTELPQLQGGGALASLL